MYKVYGIRIPTLEGTCFQGKRFRFFSKMAPTIFGKLYTFNNGIYLLTNRNIPLIGLINNKYITGNKRRQTEIYNLLQGGDFEEKLRKF